MNKAIILIGLSLLLAQSAFAKSQYCYFSLSGKYQADDGHYYESETLKSRVKFEKLDEFSENRSIKFKKSYKNGGCHIQSAVLIDNENPKNVIKFRPSVSKAKAFFAKIGLAPAFLLDSIGVIGSLGVYGMYLGWGGSGLTNSSTWAINKRKRLMVQRKYFATTPLFKNKPENCSNEALRKIYKVNKRLCSNQ